MTMEHRTTNKTVDGKPAAHHRSDGDMKEIEEWLIGAVHSLPKSTHRVLRLLIEGRSNKCIASELAITEAGVKSHITSILRAFRCTNRTQAALISFCLDHNLLSDAVTLHEKACLNGVRAARSAPSKGHVCNSTAALNRKP